MNRFDLVLFLDFFSFALIILLGFCFVMDYWDVGFLFVSFFALAFTCLIMAFIWGVGDE